MLMRLAISALFFVTGFLALTNSAQAQFERHGYLFSYLQEWAGWEAVKRPDGTIDVTRLDRPGVRIILFPADMREMATQEEALSAIEALKNEVADKYEACAPIRAQAFTPNGMGMDVSDRPSSPKCRLWVAGTPEGHLFANLRLDDGLFEQQSQPTQQAALVFIILTGARIQGEEFLKTEGEAYDLAEIVFRIPPQNIPERMIIAEHSVERTNVVIAMLPGTNDGRSMITARRAIPLFPDETGNACSDWDPGFYTIDTLGMTTLKSHWYAHASMYKRVPIPCLAFVWRQDSTGALEANAGEGWQSLASALGHQDVAGEVEKFEKGERLSIQFGDARRIAKVVSGNAGAEALGIGDILLTSDGRFWVGGRLAYQNAVLQGGVTGRYYVDGYITVLEPDNGPILVGFGGKTEAKGKITALYLGGKAYGVN